MMSDDYFQDIFKISYPDKKCGQAEADKQNQDSNVLVPLSLGSSSLAVLDILNDTLLEQKQTHRGKTGFHVEVITICGQAEFEEVRGKIELLKSKYKENSDKIMFHIVDRNQFFAVPFDLQEITLYIDNFNTLVRSSNNPSTTVEKVLASAPNKTAKEDLLNIIYTHLIKKFALQRNFKAILWGHSMTKLADEVISLTVKGRGAEIAGYLDDSSLDSKYNTAFRNFHPGRDVLLSEIDAYCHIKGLSQFSHNYVVQDTLFYDKFVDKPTKNVKLIKNMTMNELARQYFDNIEGDYSNVISTVVRTGAKLSNPDNELNQIMHCSICNAIIYKNPVNWLDGITVSKPFVIHNEEELTNYNAWEAANPDKAEKLNKMSDTPAKNVGVCYGCITTLTGMKDRKLEWIRRDDKAELTAVLQEYEIPSDDSEQ